MPEPFSVAALPDGYVDFNADGWSDFWTMPETIRNDDMTMTFKPDAPVSVTMHVRSATFGVNIRQVGRKRKWRTDRSVMLATLGGGRRLIVRTRG